MIDFIYCVLFCITFILWYTFKIISREKGHNWKINHNFIHVHLKFCNRNFRCTNFFDQKFQVKFYKIEYF